MRHVATEHLSPGMVTGRHVFPPGESSGLPLIAANVVITEGIRNRLIKAHVDQVLIDDEFSEGIEPNPPITDEVRREALAVVRNTFDKMRAPDATLTPEQLQAVDSTMSSIMNEISRRKNLLVSLSDLNVFGGGRMEHAINVCVVGCAIAKRFFDEHGWVDYRGERRQDLVPDRLQKLGIGLLLQDLGALGVPEAIWEKRGMLNAEERALMQQHPTLGVELLEGADLSPLSKVAIIQHHERYDGTGYPKGLSGDDLHDHGQIAAIAETYVSLCIDDPRTAQKKMAPHQAYHLVLQASGKLFRPDIVDAFAVSIAPYGPGATVQMQDGKYGVVSASTADPLRPIVRITHDVDGLVFSPHFELNMTKDLEAQIAKACDFLPTDGAQLRVGGRQGRTARKAGLRRE